MATEREKRVAHLQRQLESITYESNNLEESKAARLTKVLGWYLKSKRLIDRRLASIQKQIFQLNDQEPEIRRPYRPRASKTPA
jgi:hypothetical protein